MTLLAYNRADGIASITMPWPGMGKDGTLRIEKLQTRIKSRIRENLGCVFARLTGKKRKEIRMFRFCFFQIWEFMGKDPALQFSLYVVLGYF
jgi:hypothetical protein